MSWKFVFNAPLKRFSFGDAVVAASDAGYRFLLFNGDIWFITDNMGTFKTGINVIDLV
jgi:hypothetical protein